MLMTPAATLLDLEPELSKITDPTTPRPAGAGVEEIGPTVPASTFEHRKDRRL
jgi:hypothetical protein